MSNRLESLNPKKTAAKPGLKFKPKAVARKSKEERERELSEIKTEPSQRPRGSDRGRGSSRGRGRGRGASYVGTHVVSAGPLAMGSVGVGNGTTRTKTGLTADRIYTSGESSSSVSLSELKLKSRSVKKSDDPGAENDSESEDEHRSRINMNVDYAFEDSETVLFPVRPQKFVKAISDPVSVDSHSELSVVESKSPSRALTVESVKSEGIDGVAPVDVLDSLSSVTLLVNPDEKQESDEHDRILEDQKAIMDMLTSDLDSMKTDDVERDTPENIAERCKYVLIHVPQVTPIEPANSDSEPSRSHFASPSTQDFEGQIGCLNFHQSGKITMSIGNNGTVFQCAGGNPTSFLQELYVIEDNKALKTEEELAEEEESGLVLDAEGRKLAGRIHRLGNISGKIVATPVIL